MSKKKRKTAKSKKASTQKITRQACEVYSRVVGYIRPVQNWHVGKKEEFKDRKTYDKVLSPTN